MQLQVFLLSVLTWTGAALRRAGVLAVLSLALLMGCDGTPTSGMGPEPTPGPSTGEPLSPALPAAAPSADHRLPSDVTLVNGSAYDIRPGDVVCLEPGTRPFLIVDGITGRAGAPVTFTNCAGGTARIRGGETFGLVLRQSRHIRVVGSASPTDRFGLVIDGAQRAKVGLSVDDYSSHVELAFLEIKNTTFAGLMAKTDDANAGTAPGNRFVLRNLHVHDLYVHDTGGEGMYLGSTSVGPEQHLLDGLRVHDNVIVRAGWDGLQVSNATANAEVHHNVIYQGGARGRKYHGNGLQISGNTAGAYHHNLIVGSHASGVAVFGKGNLRIAKNFISTSDGIFIDDRAGTVDGSPIHVVDNAMRDIRTPFVRILNEKNAVFVENNRLDGTSKTTSIGGGAGDNVQVRGNELTALEAVVFGIPEDGNFCLTTDSPYADMGLSNCR